MNSPSNTGTGATTFVYSIDVNADPDIGFPVAIGSVAIMEPPRESDVSEGHRYWVLVLLVIPVLTVFGNVLVVLSVFKEKSLQSVTNYFIVSLAIADIAVAILVMPFAVYVEVSVDFLYFIVELATIRN